MELDCCEWSSSGYSSAGYAESVASSVSPSTSLKKFDYQFHRFTIGETSSKARRTLFGEDRQFQRWQNLGSKWTRNGSADAASSNSLQYLQRVRRRERLQCFWRKQRESLRFRNRFTLLPTITDSCTEDYDATESEISSESEWESHSEFDSEREEDGFSEADYLDDVELSREEEANDDMNNQDLPECLDVSAMDSTTEMLRIRFPYTQLTILYSDYECLGDGDFLNDPIVDFYLNYLVSHELPDKHRIQVLPAVFWPTLRIEVHKSDNKLISRQQMLSSRYRKLSEWVEDMDLFENDFLVIPINDCYHWYLCIVCYPEMLTGAGDEHMDCSQDNEDEQRKPCIMMFDSKLSQKCSLEKSAEFVRDFLEYHYTAISQEKVATECFEEKSFPTVIPSKLPQQQNLCDCGIFMLEYAKTFLQRPPSNTSELAKSGFDFAAEYPEFSAASKRHEIQQLIVSLGQEQKSLLGKVLSP
ncbi:CRE-ULP-4 protein [Aphelenchoides avenae]|nr:CRE-ULP-4 protein [Aphelenchus avenae]